MAQRHMRLERLRWTILGLLFFSTVINYLDRQAMSVLLPTLRAQLGFTSADYGKVTTVFFLAYALSQIPAGMWIDKVGVLLGFSVFIVGWSCAALLTGLAGGIISLGLAQGMMAMFEAGCWPAGTKAVADCFPQQRRAFSMAVFDSGAAVGAVIAVPLVALLAVQFGWRAAFFIVASLGFLWTFAWCWVYRAPTAHPWLAAEDRAVARAELGAPLPKRPGFGVALRRIVGERQLWGLILTRTLSTPVWWFYVFWLPDYLSMGRGFSLKEIGLYAWIPLLAVDIGKIAGGAASDRLLVRGYSATLARKSVMVVGALLMICGTKVVGAPSSAAALAWVCAAMFGYGMWGSNILALHADIFAADTMGTAVGATSVAASLGAAAFTYAVGQLVDRAGYGPAFWIAGSLPMTACVPLILQVGRVGRIGSIRAI